MKSTVMSVLRCVPDDPFLADPRSHVRFNTQRIAATLIVATHSGSRDLYTYSKGYTSITLMLSSIDLRNSLYGTYPAKDRTFGQFPAVRPKSDWMLLSIQPIGRRTLSLSAVFGQFSPGFAPNFSSVQVIHVA